MRIALFVHGFPPEAQGGAELYARTLARALARDGRDEVAVVAREARPERPEASVREVAGEPFRLFLVNHNYRELRSLRDAYRPERVGAALERLVDALRPDVAHLHHLTNLSTELVDALARRGVPIVFTLHDYWLLCQRGQLLDLDHRRCEGPTPAGCARCLGLAAGAGPATHAGGRALRALAGSLPPRAAAALLRASERAAGALSRSAPLAARGEREAAERTARMRALAERVSLFLAPSRTLRERFVTHGFPAERIALHPYGHDGEPFARRARTPSTVLRIGFLGTLMVSKAPHLALEAFAGLAPGEATLTLHGRYSAYHGDDGYRARLEPLLSRPGVRWVEGVDHDAVPAVLAELDVLVVPSIWLENAPIVIAEAFLAGVPVVCSDHGGMAELVEHERSGLHFRAGDASELRRALRRLLDEPGLLDRLRRGIPPVRRIEDDVRALRAHFEGLVAAGTPGRERPLAAVVVHHETPGHTLGACCALLASGRPPDRVYVVDNGSRDGSGERLARALPELRIVRCESNLGFAGGANAGLRRALADGAGSLLLVNSDARVEADCVERLVRALRDDPRLGIAAPAIVDAADPARVESLGLAFSARSGRFRERGAGSRLEELAGGPTPVDAVSGCVALLRRELLETIGLFDEGYYFSFEDLDLCLRARRAGFGCAVVPEARARHDGHATIGRAAPARLYYAARNHLRVAQRAAPASGPLCAGLRAACIAALNLAHALRGREVARAAGVRAALAGVLDHLRGRCGAAPAWTERAR